MWGNVGKAACLLVGAFAAAVVYDQIEEQVEAKVREAEARRAA